MCASLARLSGADLDVGSTPDTLVYRARLLSAPAPRLAQLALLASGGLVALSLLTVLIAAHATGDMPALLSLLRDERRGPGVPHTSRGEAQRLRSLRSNRTGGGPGGSPRISTVNATAQP